MCLSVCACWHCEDRTSAHGTYSNLMPLFMCKRLIIWPRKQVKNTHELVFYGVCMEWCRVLCCAANKLKQQCRLRRMEREWEQLPGYRLIYICLQPRCNWTDFTSLKQKKKKMVHSTFLTSCKRNIHVYLICLWHRVRKNKEGSWQMC